MILQEIRFEKRCINLSRKFRLLEYVLGWSLQNIKYSHGLKTIEKNKWF